jgi:alpha-tubulin suppressor-like RCC1 family protein
VVNILSPGLATIVSRMSLLRSVRLIIFVCVADEESAQPDMRIPMITVMKSSRLTLARVADAKSIVLWIVISLLFHLPARASNVSAWGAGTNVANPPDYNDYGQSIVPANLTNAISVAGGWRHSLALLQNGKLRGWGDDELGQIDSPTNSNYISVSCGRLHSLALNLDGTVAAFGDDFYGQVDVPGNLTNAIAISAGFFHSLALTSDGKVVAWGPSTNDTSIGTDPNYGQTRIPGSLSNVVAISAGGWHNLALKADGTVQGWGRNDDGQADVPDNLSNVTAIAAGAAHNLALKSDGTVVAWGQNTYGQTNVPPGLTNVVAIAAGGWHSLALKSDGTVVAWGAGNGSDIYVDCKQTLVPLGLNNVSQIAAGAVHSLAVQAKSLVPSQVFLRNPVFTTNGFSVELSTRSGHVYRLEYKDSLAGNVWTPLPLTAGSGRVTPLTDPGIAAGQRFYRVREW